MIRRQLIRTDGTVVDLPEPLRTEQISRLIGAETTDTVNLRHLGNPLHVMILDDNGYETAEVQVGHGRFELRPVRALKPVNEKATALYWLNCEPGTTHKIVGDVVIVPDDDFAPPSGHFGRSEL